MECIGEGIQMSELVVKILKRDVLETTTII